MYEYKSLISIVYELDYIITETELVLLKDLLKKMQLFDANSHNLETIFKHDEKLEAFLHWYFSFIV